MKITDEFYMNEALKEAQKALLKREVPIGCVVVHNKRIIGRAHNQTETLKDATAHAEMIAITQASSALGDWRLDSATLYVTKEPCPMCAGAMLNSRIGKLVYGIADPEMGSAGSMLNITNDPKLRRQIEVIGGIKEAECRSILQEFFVQLRNSATERDKLKTKELKN